MFNNVKSSGSVSFLTGVLVNFYRWLRYHDVCPEYDDQLKEACQVCLTINDELPKAMEFLTEMPDGFNSACSVFCGGNAEGTFRPGQNWHGADDAAWADDAEKIIKAGIAVYGTDLQYEAAFDRKSFRKTSGEDVALEVTTVEMADDTAREFYAAASEACPNISTLGKLHCRRLKNDLSRPSTDADASMDSRNTFIFLVEEAVLKHCFPGLKLEAHICDSSVGIKWIDRIRSINASTFEPLHNDFYDKNQEATLPKEWYRRQRKILENGWLDQDELTGVVDETFDEYPANDGEEENSALGW